jgi:HSP20 family protein
MSSLTRRESRGLPSLFGAHPFGALSREIDELLGHFGEEWGSEWPVAQRMPSLDLAESDESLEVKMDIPGMKPEDIEIHVTGDTLTVSGRHTEEKKDENKEKKLHRVERRTGSFQRSVTLPVPVREADVTAEYQHGVLTITLPKTEPEKTHRVAIKS